MSFVRRLREGERISDLCREFGISRKTAYKFVARYEDDGPLGLLDQRRVADRIPHRTSDAIVTLIVNLRRKHPTWGPRKLREVLSTRHAETRFPAVSTVGDILARSGLIVRKRRRKHHFPTPYPMLSTPVLPNDVWCIDYKGQFRLGNGRYCYPLTVTDAATRYVLACEAFESIDGADVRKVLEHLFKTVGLPKAIRFDGGAPFASNGLMRLSRLSAWWMSLGIKLEQIEPGSPQQNGRHERMHRTLKAETTRPPAERLLQQQARFDKWVEIFNHERPHEGIEMKRPAQLYEPSTRLYSPMSTEYPLHDLTLRVSSQGRIRFPNSRRGDKQYFLSESLEHHIVGLRELDDGRWLVTFVDVDLGTIDRNTQCFMPKEAPPTSPPPTLETGIQRKNHSPATSRRKGKATQNQNNATKTSLRR